MSLHAWELYAMWAWFAIFFGDSLRAAAVADARTLGSLGTFAVIGAGAIGLLCGRTAR